MVPTIGFCGASGSGKTTLLEKLLAELAGRGRAVGAIKHHGHGGAPADPAALQAKDTARLHAAGARRVVLAHPGGLSMVAEADFAGLDPAAIVARFFYDLDLVLVEGFKTADIAKIEVVAPGAAPLLPAGGQLLALARRGGGPVEADLPVLDADNPAQVADFVLQAIPSLRHPPAGLVRLRVGGVELGVNHFSQNIIANTIRGLLGGFKGGDAPGRIEVEIEP